MLTQATDATFKLQIYHQHVSACIHSKRRLLGEILKEVVLGPCQLKSTTQDLEKLKC